MSRTILYYTSNAEDPGFEQKIVDDLLSKAGDLPIISVSQKPMALGTNICVGERGLSYVNEYRQILAGLEQVTTDYVLTAESDFLYAPEYFQFEPASGDLYRYANVWIIWMRGLYRNFHRKRFSDGAQLIKREYFIRIVERFLRAYPGWWGPEYLRLPPHHSPYRDATFGLFGGDTPCVSVKTGRGCNWYSGFERGPENIAKELPYWGKVGDLRRRLS